MGCLHSFQLYLPDYCRRLYAELRKLPVEAPNSMNKYGRYLDEPRWQERVDGIVERRVAPIAKRCFGVTLAKKGHYAFAVEYAVGRQKSLAEHFDSSDVTLNLCVGGRFTGGDLVFTARYARFEQAIGRAFIHLGSELHRALPLKSGKRMNLVVWCKRR